MQTIRDLCEPHPNVRRSDPEPDIEDIAEVIEAAERDAAVFFARNHITGGMRQLFELGIARPFTDTLNARSIAVMKRIGMLLDHTAELVHEGETFSAVIYAITRKRWQSNIEPLAK